MLHYHNYCAVSYVHWQWMGCITNLFHVVISLDFSEAHWHAICFVLCTGLGRISSVAMGSSHRGHLAQR